MPRKNEALNDVDILIGRKIHDLRIELGMSRQQLADKIGVTHQQLQKYEKASNRISGGRLAAIAKATNQKVGWFFEDDETEIETNLPTRLHMEIARKTQKISNREQLQAVNMLLNSMVWK